MNLVVSTDTLIVVQPAETAEQEAFTKQLLSLIPRSWNSEASRAVGGILHTILSSFALVFVSISTLISNSKKQLRVRTASGKFLDLIARDYFGAGPVGLPRKYAELDEDYRKRILTELLRPRCTPKSIVDAVSQLTGGATGIFEPFNTTIACCWGGIMPVGPPQTPIWPTYSCWSSNSIDQFIPVMRLDNVMPGSTNPNPGVGGMGDLFVIYTFYVELLTNPRGVPTSVLQELVDRLKAAGTKGIVLGGVN